jgi:hypothetical protein
VLSERVPAYSYRINRFSMVKTDGPTTTSNTQSATADCSFRWTVNGELGTGPSDGAAELCPNGANSAAGTCPPDRSSGTVSKKLMDINKEQQEYTNVAHRNPFRMDQRLGSLTCHRIEGEGLRRTNRWKLENQDETRT